MRRKNSWKEGKMKERNGKLKGKYGEELEGAIELLIWPVGSFLPFLVDWHPSQNSAS